MRYATVRPSCCASVGTAAAAASPGDALAGEFGPAAKQLEQARADLQVQVCLARKLGRPVRWIEDRREAFAGATHGRGQTQQLRLAADSDGRILALEALIDGDIGAYPHSGSHVVTMTGWWLAAANCSTPQFRPEE